MCALFCEPRFRDFGVHWLGQRGFGGLLEDYSQRTDGKSVWIPQYNLAAFWRRDIPPISVGFVEPLIPARLRGSKFDRLPGHLSFKTETYNLENRNLLETKYSKEDGNVRIWTVNERSRRYCIEKYDLQIDERGVIQSDNWYDDNITKEWKTDKESILELRKSLWNCSAKDSSLWVRTCESLNLLKDESSDEIVRIFKSPVKNFGESYGIIGEYCIIDHGGMVWLGDLENNGEDNVRRLKIENEIDDDVFEHIAWSNHPRRIAFATKYHVNIFDTRTKSDILSLFATKSFETRNANDPLSIQENAPKRETICHIRSINNSTNNFVVLTNYSIHLVDDRFPKNSIVTVNYGIHPHKIVLSENGYREENGEVFSIFILDQLLSEIHHCKLYKHNTGIWSDVNGLRSLKDTDSFNSTCRRGKFVDDKNIRNEPNRSISLIEGVINKKQQEMCILLRQTDDGSIWNQTFMNKNLSQKKLIKYEKKSWSKVKDYIEKCDNFEPVYVMNIPEELKRNPKDERVAVALDGHLDKRTVKRINTTADVEMRQTGGLHFDDSEISSNLIAKNIGSENFVLSKVVMDAWK